MGDLSAITRKVIELKLDQNIYTVIEEILWNENAKSISAAAYNFIVETGISEDVALVEADSLDSQLSCSEKDTTADKNA